MLHCCSLLSLILPWENKRWSRDRKNGKFGKERCVNMFKPLDKKEPGETAQWLRMLADLLEDPSPVTRTHVRRLIAACSSSSQGSSACGHLHYMHIPTHKFIQIHIIKDKSIVKNIWKMGIPCFLLLSPSIPLFISP